MSNIILASQSPRRKMLLEWAAIAFEVVVSDAEENFPSSLPKQEVPVFIARNKALAVQALLNASEDVAKDKCIIAADTIVVVDKTILGKPVDKADAMASLNKLSGRTHQVITGMVILYQGNEYTISETTQVEFHQLTKEQIEYYVDNYKPYDKAGAYAIQEWIGVVGIKNIQGDFYNVMGLPVSKLVQKIKQLGII